MKKKTIVKMRVVGIGFFYRELGIFRSFQIFLAVSELNIKFSESIAVLKRQMFLNETLLAEFLEVPYISDCLVFRWVRRLRKISKSVLEIALKTQVIAYS
jgi:hypothetical protein